jgi:hypothetical protein
MILVVRYNVRSLTNNCLLVSLEVIVAHSTIAIGPVVFVSRTQTYATYLKEYDVRINPLATHYDVKM